jgi:hypothetical protein
MLFRNMSWPRTLPAAVGKFVHGCALIGLGLSAGLLGTNPCAAAPNIPFTQPFDISTSKIGLSPANRSGLFRESDNITISTTNNQSIRILSISGTVVYQGAPRTLIFSRGHYFVETAGDRTQFAVLPDDYQGASFLGTEGAESGWGWDAVASRVMSIQPSYVRYLEWWELFQPDANTFNWDWFDARVQASAGRKIILTIFKKPDWVPPNEFITRYATLMRLAATRYAGQIYGLEIWNEPQPTGDYRLPVATNTWDAVADFYGQLVDACTTEIRSVSPSLQIIGPAWYGKGFVAETARIDPAGRGLLLSFHESMLRLLPPDYTGDYAEADHIVSGLAVQLPRLMPNPLPGGFLVDELDLYGKSALGIPSTGDGLYLSDTDWARGMNRGIKATVMYRAAGAAATIGLLTVRAATNTNELYEIYGWEYAPNGDRGPHPKTSAFLMTCYWLNGAMFVETRTLGAKLLLYAWQRPNNTSVVFAWALEGQTANLKPNTGLTTTDIFGRTIQISTVGEEPVLFQASNSSASALLSAVVSAVDASVNLPPVWDSLANQNIKNSQPLQFTVSATDPDSDALTYSVGPLPAGASFNPVSRTFSWTPALSAVGSYQVSFTATDARGLSTSVSTTITVLNNIRDGMLDYWKLDEGSGTTTADSVGTNPGTLLNFTSGWVTGKSGKALSFDGVNDYVRLDSTKLILTNNFTVSAWVYPRNAAGYGSFFSACSTYLNSGFRFFVAGNSLQFQGRTTAGWKSSTLAEGALANNSWYHIVIVYDKSTIKAYVNGVFQGSEDWGGNLVMNPLYPSKIGTEGGYYFNGSIDDVIIYKRTLGTDEILTLFQNPGQVLSLP